MVNIDQSAVNELFELRNESLDFINYIDETEILKYLKEDIVHFPLFLHLDPATELEKLKGRNCCNDEQYRNLIHASHSFNKFILKIAKRGHISYINFRYSSDNKETIFQKIHEEIFKFLQKNKEMDLRELNSKTEELIEMEVIGIKSNI